MRSYLQQGTWIRLLNGDCYEIIGNPIGECGGHLIYSAIKQQHMPEGGYIPGSSEYVLKECYPVSSKYFFERTNSGEILLQSATEKGRSYSSIAREMQMNEQRIIDEIYKNQSDRISVLDSSVGVDISSDGGTSFMAVQNAVTIMESFSNRGGSLKAYLSDQKRIPALQAFSVIEQVLYAVRAIHHAGYLHLDIQEGNIFIRGQLFDKGDFVFLADFGSARKLYEDGLCAVIEDQKIFSSQESVAPEMILKNDGTLRLGPEADIYSIGYLLLLLLTGQRYSFSELNSNRDGHYLTKYMLRKIDCPKHLNERMQKILAKALANEAARRYHSCDEMLLDITDFLEVLQSYRKDLSQVAYDAFISYKHGPVDSVAAKTLQERLEHFHAPHGFGGSRKRIKRVFVDEGELSSCSNFVLQIRAALRNAEWLIVVCSPETKTSPWVDLEIRTFLEYHDQSRILAVMTSGEPEDCFPNALLQLSGKSDEILAADARGQDLKTVLKKLKKDALLRIAAPILGTTYDSLKQRHRVYMMQRITIASSIFLALLLAFTFYTLWQSFRINEQYQQSRRNQARYLSGISMELLNSGDRNKALLTALAVEPEDDADGAVVPEQIYALNNALASYKNDWSGQYNPAYVGEADDVGCGILSPDGKYYYAIDGCGNAVVLSGENGELQWTITPSEIRENISDLYRYSQNEDFDEVRLLLPLTDDRIAVGLTYCMAIIDVKKHAIISTFPLDMYCAVMSREDYDQKGDLFAYTDSYGKLMIYNLKSGEKICYFDLNDDSENTKIEYRINDISFKEDGTSVALGLSYSYTEEQHSAEWTDDPGKEAAGIMVYSLLDGSRTVVSAVPAGKVLFADDSHIAAIHYTGSLSESNLKDLWGYGNYSYYQALYDISSNELLFMGETMTVLDTSATGLIMNDLELNDETISCLITWIRGSMSLVDKESGKSLTEITYRSNIVGVSVLRNLLLVCLDDGTVQMLVLGNNIGRYKMLSLSSNISQYAFNKKTRGMVLLSEGRLLFCNNGRDTGLNVLDISNFVLQRIHINDVYYEEIGGENYRCLLLHQSSVLQICGFAVYPVNSDECIYQYISPQTGSSILNIGFGYDHGDVYVCFVEKTPDEQRTFFKVNITAGDTVIQEDITTYETLRFDNISGVIYSNDMKTMFVGRREGVVRFDISGDVLIPDSRAILAHQEIDEMKLTGDKQYLVLAAKNDSRNEREIFIYSLKNQILKKLELEETISSNYVSEFLISGQCSSYICLYDGGKSLYIVDCESETVISVIDVEESSNYAAAAALFGHDEYLLFLKDDTVMLYDLKNSEVVHTYTGAYSSVGGLEIITDNSSQYFALKDMSIHESLQYDSGISMQPLHIFYVDDNHKFYPYASVDYGYASLSGEEISVLGTDKFAYAGFYDYTYLKKKALEILDGETLTDKDRQKYFIAE